MATPSHPLAGQPAPADLLVDLGKLKRDYYNLKPDPNDPQQRVSFGTSGHRGERFMVKTTCASVRYFIPSVPICVIVDGDFSVTELEWA